MGALPSRESHEGPNTVYFGNNTGVVTFRLPLTPHYFPSPDCLAFKEVHRVRNSQSCKYSFDIAEASAVLPDAAADAFQAAQREDWGPEAAAQDPSLHYRDADVQERLRELGLPPTTPPVGNSSARRLVIEGREELYHALVTAPTAGAVVDTDAEMCQLFAQEQRWRAARAVVRRHRAFLQQTSSAAGTGAADAARPTSPEATAAATEELARAEAVPPPRMWLRPIPEVILERMSMEDTLAAHAAYREKQQQQSTRLDVSVRGSSTSSTSGGGGGADSGAAGSAGVSRVPPVSPQQQPHRPAGVGALRTPECEASICQREEAALNVLDVQGRAPLVETHSLDEDQLLSYPSFQTGPLPFELDERYMDGRVHLVAHAGVNYVFAYNPDYVRAMGRTVAVDGSVVAGRWASSTAKHSARCRTPFTTTHTVATRRAEDFEDVNQRRAYELIQPVYERYYIPVLPVRVLGVDGLLPCDAATAAAPSYTRQPAASGSEGAESRPQLSPLRGAPWLRGVEGDEAEEQYEEVALWERYGVAPPPVLRACRFIHAVMGEKILNRMTVLRALTFREMCILAGLPDAIACPVWAVFSLSDIPQLQLQREVELRLLAAMREIDDGDMRVRNALARRHRWNDYVEFTNSPKYGFMVRAPPERRFRTNAEGDLHEVDADEEGEGGSLRGGDGDAGADGNSAEDEEVSERPREKSLQQQLKQQARPARRQEVAAPARSAAPVAVVAQAVNQPAKDPISDGDSPEQRSGSTSGRSAAHVTATTAATTLTPASASAAARTPSPNIRHAHVKRTRERDAYMTASASTPPTTTTESDAAAAAQGKAPEDGEDDDDLSEQDDLARYLRMPVADACGWAFKRRRLGLTAEEVTGSISLDITEEWAPMVNPLTKDAALAELGVRVTLRGRRVLVRYSGSAMRKLFYYLSQASAPIFCLPYVGAPQHCPTVRLEGVVRVDDAVELRPPTAEQVRRSRAAYATGDVCCYVFADLRRRPPNPPTWPSANHFHDADVLHEPISAGVTSPLTLAQVPVKVDVRRALEWYRQSYVRGLDFADAYDGTHDEKSSSGSAEAATPASAGGRSKTNAPEGNPYASWPVLLDAPAACDGDVLAVCPRTHRWLRASTLILIAWFSALHAELRHPERGLPRPLAVLDFYKDPEFAAEVNNLHDKLVLKNMDSAGTLHATLRTRSYFSYNGIVELLLDGLRGVVDRQAYEDKDDAGWLQLRGGTGASTDACGGAATATAAAAGAGGLCRYLECSSYYIWSFVLGEQRFFMGTKPRFIRQALQRQRQNQRRRQKRKGKDGAAAGTAEEPLAIAAEAKDEAALTPQDSVADAVLQQQPAKVTQNATPPKRSHADSHASIGGVSSTVLISPSDGALSVATPTDMQASKGASYTTDATPPTSLTSTRVHQLPAPPPPPLPQPLSFALVGTTNAGDDVASTRNGAGAAPAAVNQRRSTAATVHEPYAPLHLLAEDRLDVDERLEMLQCRQHNRLWAALQGVYVEPSSSLQPQQPPPRCALPPSSSVSAAAATAVRWASPSLAGTRGVRQQRYVVPITPYGLGPGRLVQLPEAALQGAASTSSPSSGDVSVRLVTDAVAAAQALQGPMPPGAEEGDLLQSPRSAAAGAAGLTSSHEGAEEDDADGVPVQRLATPREVVSTSGNTFRWNPYRL